ncbi:hypothetical protein H6G28_13520 [Nostoc sp. FACHB-190]|nr:hypothetical protein [Nostoc sp. FACHB-190]
MNMSNKPEQSPLSFVAPIKAPVADNYKALKKILETGTFGEALDEVGTVHFGRFMFLEQVTPESGEEYYAKFALFTAYDGDFTKYVDDFVAVVGDFFNLLLQHLEDGDQVIPVQKNAQDFAQYVHKYDQEVKVWYSAYPNLNVVDIRQLVAQP